MTYKAVADALGLARYRSKIPNRNDAALPFDPSDVVAGERIVLDTCTIIDGLKGSLPHMIGHAIARTTVVSSAVVVGELAHGHAILDPNHPATAHNGAIIKEAVARAEASPVQVTPTAAHWTEAHAVVATIARCNGFAKDARGKLLDDALLYVSARDAGMRLVTANIRDFDLVDQVAKGGKLLFYRPVP